MDPAPAGRYAPSPTGDLHLGNLRTALVAWLFARSTSRRFLLRIEDLDRGRSRAEAEASQRRDLASLQLSFDPPELRQSGRAVVYAAALERLGDRVYECFCTRREIAEAASAPHGAPAHYPGICRNLSERERAERRRVRPAALRLRADGATETISELVAAETSGGSGKTTGVVTGVVDDLVLRRNDGGHAYHLAVVVDDGETGVDQVVRGDDLLDAAPGQAHLARLLGYPVPTYAHVPLVLGPSGARLAKRDGAVTLADLASHGIGPDRVLSALATSLGLADVGEPVDLAILLERFDPALLPRTPWTFTTLLA